MKVKLSVIFPNEIIKELMEEQNLATENEALVFMRGYYQNEFDGQPLELMVEAIEESEVAERREGVEESPVDCSTPSVTELQRGNEMLRAELKRANKDKQILYDEIDRPYR